MADEGMKEGTAGPDDMLDIVKDIITGAEKRIINEKNEISAIQGVGCYWMSFPEIYSRYKDSFEDAAAKRERLVEIYRQIKEKGEEFLATKKLATAQEMRTLCRLSVETEIYCGKEDAKIISALKKEMEKLNRPPTSFKEWI